MEEEDRSPSPADASPLHPSSVHHASAPARSTHPVTRNPKSEIAAPVLRAGCSSAPLPAFSSTVGASPLRHFAASPGTISRFSATQRISSCLYSSGSKHSPLAHMVTKPIDLRSDTVTRPTESMRAVMAGAEVDDDVLGNDPTTFRLETEVARIMGKEVGLFLTSGTMGNLICVLVHHDSRGSEVILGDQCHIHVYENGGISALGGFHPRTVKNNEDGTMDLNSIEAAIRGLDGDLHYPTTRLICLENSHGNSGGRCLSVEYTDKVGELAKKYGLKLHVDGARIFNVATALGVPIQRLVQAADSVSVCLSKGLGAPVGYVIVGSSSFINKFRRYT